MKGQMTRYKGIIIFWGLFMILSGVSVYFYFQHVVSIRTYKVNDNISFQDAHVMIREIALENFKPKESEFTPWYYKLIDHLPPRLRLLSVETCAFLQQAVSVQPQSRQLTCHGMIACPLTIIKDYNTNPEHHVYFKINGAAVMDMSYEHDDGSNIIYFNESAPCRLDVERFNFTAAYTSKDARTLTITPAWHPS